jgi:A/G-specific adenine glycosylase
VAAIAFGVAATPVDGNVVRVLARLHGIATPLPQLRREIVDHAASLAPAVRPGDFAQALMDLGATVCLARQPRCTVCPWSGSCVARATGAPERLPVRSPKPERPQRHGVAFWIGRADGTVLLRRRPARGLLGGMMEFPGTPWSAEPWQRLQAQEHAPLPAAWHWLGTPVAHTFTHFQLQLQVAAGTANGSVTAKGGIWQPIGRLDEAALPSVMRKVAAAVLASRDQEWWAHES